MATGAVGGTVYQIKGAIPPEILNQCRVLKKRWEQLSPLSLASANLVDETGRHPTRCDLRATISLKQISSAAFARPHFLIEFEDLRGSSGTGYQIVALPCRTWFGSRVENRIWHV